MLNRKLIMLTIFLVSLFAISAASAADNGATDVNMADGFNSHDGMLLQANDEVQSDVGGEKLQAVNDGEILTMEEPAIDSKSSSSLTKNDKVTIKPTKLSTSYVSGKCFEVKVTDSHKNSISSFKILLKVQTGKKYKKVILTTDSYGVAKYDASKLSVGKHKIVVSAKSKNVKADVKTSQVKISKAKLKISAPKQTSTYRSGKFNVVVKNGATNNPMSNVKVNIKVFTGKKYKTYNVKTNKKGVASISTKKLSLGSHKVVANVKSTENIKAKSVKSSVIIAKNVKLKTHIEIVDKHYLYSANGSPGSISYTINLVDEHGKVLHGKKIHKECEVYYVLGGHSFTDYEVFTSGGEVTCQNYAFFGSTAYLIVGFDGDSSYEKCELRISMS